jgi:hypothetical protein
LKYPARRHCHANLIQRQEILAASAPVQAAVAARHVLECLPSENAERVARSEMALDIERVVDGGVNRQKALCRSGRFEPLHLALAPRTGWCEFSARLFLRKRNSW